MFYKNCYYMYMYLYLKFLLRIKDNLDFGCLLKMFCWSIVNIKIEKIIFDWNCDYVFLKSRNVFLVIDFNLVKKNFKYWWVKIWMFFFKRRLILFKIDCDYLVFLLILI